ncbi:MAG: hypothetical protein KBF57_00865 [Saprospiraceae bacterium]|jgi:hypothetical protein|nr:hypothetical protein [Saprospiraceae bacterium]MBP9193203.1 hypothetical protein [Saprospiraceae bacterium]
MVRELIALAPESRVWLYAASRELSYEELDIAREMLLPFLEEWTSHSRELMCYGNIFHQRFLGIFVDESMAPASGCSIDASSRFVQQLSEKLKVDFFSRSEVFSLQNDKINAWNLQSLSQSYIDGEFNNDTLFFDNLVTTKEAFLRSWLVPLKDSWINRFVR